jgi:hypothetical protein
MSVHTLPVLSRSEFPQVFRAATESAFDNFASAPRLSRCAYIEPLAHDLVRCHRQGTVHHIEDGLEFCAAHFEAVSRG